MCWRWLNLLVSAASIAAATSGVVACGQPSARPSQQFGPSRVSFAPALTCPGALSTDRIVAADFNGDGFVDLVTGGWSCAGCYLLLGKGDGTFQPPCQIVPYPQSLPAVADVNHDGKPDIVMMTAARDVSYLLVFLSNGDGSFHQLPHTSFSEVFYDLVLGDLDEDGQADAICASVLQRVCVLRRAADGTFRMADRLRCGEGSIFLAAADLNGDSHSDVLAFCPKHSALRSYAGRGDGTFLPSVSVETLVNRPRTAAIADLDSDGHLDAATADFEHDGVNVLFGSGDLGFRPPILLRIGGNLPIAVAAADLNRDDLPDLVTANWQSSDLTILFGSGDGAFCAQPGIPVGRSPRCVLPVDVNGDGYPDLVAANYFDGTLSILLNKGPDRAFEAVAAPFEAQTADLAGAGPVPSARGESEPPMERRGSSRYHAVSWTTGQGLPQNTIQCLLRTRDGYLWVGTRRGLARFDGHEFTVFDENSRPPLAHCNCRSLAADDEGQLWVGTNDGLVRLRGTNAVFYPLTASGANQAVIGIALQSASRAVLATSQGAHLFENGRFTRLDIEPSGQPSVFGRPGEAAYFRNATGLFKLEVESHEPELIYSEAFAQIGRAVLLDLNKRVWFGSGFDLDCWEAGRVRIITPKDGGWDWDGEIQGLSQDSEGGVWAATVGGGLRRLREKQVLGFTTADGLDENDIHCVHADQEGNIWAGTYTAGLNCLQPRRVINYTTKDGLPDNDVWSVSEARDGSLWIATGQGISHLKDGGFTRHRITMPDDGERIEPGMTAICDGPDGPVWAGGGGCGRWTRNGFKVVHPECSAHTSFYRDTEGDLWSAGGNEVGRWEGGQWRVETSIPEPNPDLIGIVKDADGRLWFGSARRGLFCLDSKRLVNLTRTKGLTSDHVAPVLADRDGTVWAASDRGLNRIQDGRITCYTKAQGLPEDIVLNVLEDDYGWFWLNGHHGIHRVRKQELNDVAAGKRAVVEAVTYGETDGMLSSEGNGGWFPNSCKTRDGRLWFPTVRGLVMIDPRWVTRDQAVSPVRIERILANNAPVFERGFSGDSPVPKVSLEPGAGRALEIRYSAVSFVAPERTLFKYRLEGEDRDWVDAQHERRAVYTNLRPGRYRFQVIARNAQGVWNRTGDGFDLFLAPFFYETRWFYTVCGMGLAGLALTVQAHRLRGQRRILTLEHEAALSRERERIARDMHDDVGASLAKVRLLSEIAESKNSADPELRSYIHGISETSAQVAQSMDEIVWAVNPGNDALSRLADYISRTAEEVLHLARIRCRLKIPVHLPAVRLSSEFRHGVFLVLKEALHNITKHAQATETTVQLTFDPGRLVITVEDNGRGFDASAVPPSDSDGLANMSRRAQMLGGSMEIRSQPGRGTCLVLSVPLPSP